MLHLICSIWKKFRLCYRRVVTEQLAEEAYINKLQNAASLRIHEFVVRGSTYSYAMYTLPA